MQTSLPPTSQSMNSTQPKQPLIQTEKLDRTLPSMKSGSVHLLNAPTHWQATQSFFGPQLFMTAKQGTESTNSNGETIPSPLDSRTTSKQFPLRSPPIPPPLPLGMDMLKRSVTQTPER